MISEKTIVEIIAHKKKVDDLYRKTGKDLYRKISEACQAELDLRAQKKSEVPEERLEVQKEVQGQYRKTEGVENPEELIEQIMEFASRTKPRKPQELQSTMPAALGELDFDDPGGHSIATLGVKMVNGKVLTFTYGTIRSMARSYFANVMETKPFTEKRYNALPDLDMFKNLVRLVKGWGVLKTLDKNNPEYPAVNDIFKIQRQTRPELVNQAKKLLDLVLETIGKDVEK